MNKQELLDELREDGFSEGIIDAFSKVKREDYIPDGVKQFAYENGPLPIGEGQTISQPYTIAFMLDLLKLHGSLKILEIGSGSGYVLALMNEISDNSKIYGVERVKKLVENSRKILNKKENIKIILGDGTKDLGIKGRFDRILVSAAARKIPDILIERLSVNGILVLPVNNSIFQIKKENGKILKKEYPGFVFVPLISDE